MKMQKKSFIEMLDNAVRAKISLIQFSKVVNIIRMMKKERNEKRRWTEPTIEQRMDEMKDGDISGGKGMASEDEYRKWATEEWNENHKDYEEQNNDADYPIGGMVERYDIERDEKEDFKTDEELLDDIL